MTNPGLRVPPRRRRRPAKSCEQCRRRKIRCDQKLPCAACIRARASLECSYRPVSLVTSTSTAEPSLLLTPESRSETLHEQHHRAEVDIQQEKTISELCRHVQSLQAQVVSLEQQNALTPSGPTAVQKQGGSAVSGTSSQLSAPDTCTPAATPRLRNAPHKTKLFGQSHWIHTAEQFQVVGKFDATEIEPAFNAAQAELGGLMKEARGLRQTLIAQNLVQLAAPVPDLLGTLPPRTVCVELVRSYLRTFEPIYRVVHVPSFWKDYDAFWEQGAPTLTPTPFLMKLIVILAIGSAFLQESINTSRTDLVRSAQAWIYAAQWWLTGPPEKSTAALDGLQVFCLLLIARKATHSCPGTTAWLSPGSLVTMAQTMGLHRDPKMFASLAPYQVQMRARLWTTILELVCMSSLDLALPPNISGEDYDASPPDNVDDRDLDPAGTIATVSSEVVTDSSGQILLAKSLPLRLRVVRFLNDFRSEQSYQTALQLGSELRTACREVAAFFHSCPPRSDENGSVLPLTEFHRKFLDIYLRRYILLLHRPFMLQARRDPRFYLARKLCVESSTVIGSYTRTTKLDDASSAPDDLLRLSMVGRGVFKCSLSLDVIMVLALEVINQLEEEGPVQGVPDPLDDLNRTSRARLVRILEDISDRLLEVIERGSPTLKRYMFISAYLSQIRAMESGQPVKQVVYEAMLEAMRKCKFILQSQAQRVASASDDVVALNVTDATTTSTYPVDISTMDTDVPWDMSYLLDWPLLSDDWQTNWAV